MRPYISDKPLRRLNIPDLSGGVNYRDGISQVLDNQLTDCNNVWFKDGVLQTRPGIKTLYNYFSFGDNGEHQSVEDCKNAKIFIDDKHFKVINGKPYFLTALRSSKGLEIFYCNEDMKSSPWFLCSIGASELPKLPIYDYNCLFFHQNNAVYLFISGYYDEKIPYYVFKIIEDGELLDIVRITDDTSEEDGGFYVPTVMINCKANGSMHFFDEDGIPTVEGDNFEGYNLLGNKYKMLYTTVNKALYAEDETTSIPAQYELLHPVKSGDIITVNVTLLVGEGPTSTAKRFTHTVKIGAQPDSNGWFNEEYDKSNPPEDKIYLRVSGRTLCFYSCKTPEEHKFFHLSDFVDYNNMEIIASCPNKQENYEKILNMTKAEWFGGGSEGIYGGIHLFLCGNTKEEEKALVCWSDVKKPLYFSENSHSYVGDKSQRATAFGKQGESLIIFKEREMYATQYSAISSPIDSDAVSTQAVIDVAAAEVTFPMKEVHGYIGCDCPDTVQLCRNRLVWAHSDGNIYTLTSQSQWNERNVFKISDMVETKIREHSRDELKISQSADWEGHYILSLGDKLLLMDYNSYGYTHIAAYSKDEDAQLRIPWWIWEKPKYMRDDIYKESVVNVSKMISMGNQLYLLSENEFYESAPWILRRSELMILDGERDIVNAYEVNYEPGGTQTVCVYEALKEITSKIQTKLFDFGGATMQKSIPKCEISFGKNGGNPITVTTITDHGESSEEIILDFEETDKRNPQFFKSVAIRNGQKLNNRIGYKFESNGNIFIDSMMVYFKTLGGSK